MILFFLFASMAFGQRLTGELRLLVADSSGGALQASGALRSQSTNILRSFATQADGRHVFRALPFGVYRLQVERPGFSAQSVLVEIRSESPLEQRVTLGVAPVETTVVVKDSDTLLDPSRTGSQQFVGAETIKDRRGGAPGRSVLEMVNTQPGWLLEANGVLHPRGSEYDVQYVIDGIPLYDNRSPAFAQSLGIEEFESMNVRTGNYPAEFGRKLGGVIEVATERDTLPGPHGKAILQGGSFAARSGFASLQYSRGKTSIGASGEGMMTDRYLDPPVLENFSNHGSGGGFSARLERDRTRFYVHYRRTGFLVPNEFLQQAAGQRQDREAGETLGHVSHQHILSPRVLVHVRAMVRDTHAGLWSNNLSTPILPAQTRGFREGYIAGSVAAHYGGHEFKAGGEALFSSIHESFSYRITAYRIGTVRIFDRDLPATFQFADRRSGRDQSAFAQDLWRIGKLTLSAGIRFDHYRLVQDETAWSPRLGAAYHLPSAGVVVRASYDRIFAVPAMENILLASSNQARNLGGGAFLPLRPSRGNFFEAGFSKSAFGKLRLDANWFRRRVDHFADDSLLLNTGVSFPISFAEAEIHGYEAKIEVPSWGRFSGFASFGNLHGRGTLPVSGGLFLGDDVGALVNGKGVFPISQDQRNSVRSRVRFQAHRRVWFAVGGGYNSGLPFEIEGPANMAFIRQQYGPRILSKVNFDRERIRPSASIDASAGVDVLKSEKGNVRLQADVLNAGNRLNLINFAGVFSGTAVEPGRTLALRLTADLR